MARKRLELGPAIDREIRERAARGETVDQIQRGLSVPVSYTTVRRRREEALQGLGTGAAAGQAVGAGAGRRDVAATVAGVPDEPPDGSTIEQIDHWIAELEEVAQQCKRDGSLATFAGIAAKVGSLMALRHRAMPIPKLDPNENPDFKALAAQARDRLKKLVDGLFE